MVLESYGVLKGVIKGKPLIMSSLGYFLEHNLCVSACICIHIISFLPFLDWDTLA